MTDQPALSIEMRAAVGDVALAAARLEDIVVHLVAMVRGWTLDRQRRVLSRAGGARKAIASLAKDLPDDEELRRLVDDKERLLSARSRLLHSVLVVVTDEPVHLLLWHPKSDDEYLPDPSEAAECAREMDVVGARTLHLLGKHGVDWRKQVVANERAQMLADQTRTTEAPE